MALSVAPSRLSLLGCAPSDVLRGLREPSSGSSWESPRPCLGGSGGTGWGSFGPLSGRDGNQEVRDSNSREASTARESLQSVADEQVLYLTTIGRTTGLPHVIETWFVACRSPYQECACWLAERIPGCRLTMLSASVGHYVLLCEATAYGQATAPDICRDAPGIERRTIHNQTTEELLALFQCAD